MTRQVISFDKVCFSYDRSVEVLRNVTFSIQEGERVALVGLNGSGKSTLLLHTNGLLRPDSGSVTVDGIGVDAASRKKITLRVGMVFQNSDDQLFMPTVEEDVAFGPANMGLSRDEISRRVDEALKLTGTVDLRHRAPFQLSGGEKRMVALATVLSMHPSVLVLDEPTTGLDYLAARRFAEAIESLPHTLLMSTHDIAMARRLCSRAILMDRGAIVYDGPIASLPYPPEPVTKQ